MEWSQVLAIVLPVMLTIIIGIFYNNRRIDDLRSNMNERFSDIGERFSDVNERFADMNQRIIDLTQQMNRQFAELKTEIRENRSMLMQFPRKEAEL